MLKDANFFSRLGKDLQINPLLKDYLSFGCQLYVDHPADKGEVTPDNLPGHQKSKKSKQKETSSNMVNVANLVFDTTLDQNPIFEHHLPMELDPVMNQIPIIFHTTTRMQPK
jgi:hypothetical protein